MANPTPPSANDAVEAVDDVNLDAVEHIFYLLYHVARHRDLRLEAGLAPLGLSIAHWRSLAIIRRIEDCSMTHLSRLTGVDRTTLTRSVDHLVAVGLVDRRVPVNDRRLVTLRLTEAGRALQAEALEMVRSLNREQIELVDPARWAMFAELLESLLRKLIVDPDAAEEAIGFARERKTPPGREVSCDHN